jgi:hypothetical protein
MSPVSTFIAHPWVAFAVAAICFALWSWRRHLLAGIAGTAWLGYGMYEYLMFARVLCTGECNIRVDLLAIYPALLVLSALALVLSLKSAKPATPSSAT